MADMNQVLKRFEQAQDALLVTSGEVALGSLVDRVESGVIDLDPAFQRRERWTRQKQSALIESFLLNVPIPPIFLAEEPKSPFLVIDGKQRLQAVADFFRGDLVLTDLERFTELEGTSFEELHPDIRQALDIRMSLDVVTVLRQSDPSWKYEVFYRLNTGGETLNPQEVRNVAFRSPLNTEIMLASENSFLRQQLKIRTRKSPAFARMVDAELVLRFLTMRRSWKEFGRPYRQSLDDFMRGHIDLGEKDAKKLIGRFNRAVDRCEALWGDLAFRRPTPNGWRDQLISAMYDAQMVAVDAIGDSKLETLIGRSDAVVAATEDLGSDETFVSAITVATNNRANVRYRVQKISDMLSSVAAD